MADEQNTSVETQLEAFLASLWNQPEAAGGGDDNG
jgi:hypothetical protein